MKLVLITIFLGQMQITSYRSVPSQTDSSPFITATGERVCRDGVAVSQDLLKSKKVRYGDWLYIPGVGLRRINDCMNIRHKNAIDVWVPNLKAEQEFHRRWKGKRAQVYLIKETK